MARVRLSVGLFVSRTAQNALGGFSRNCGVATSRIREDFIEFEKCRDRVRVRVSASAAERRYDAAIYRLSSVVLSTTVSLA